MLDFTGHIRPLVKSTKNATPIHDILENCGLRVTHQRLSVATHIFGKNNRLIDASKLYEDIAFSGADISLATIYNTLHHFTKAGLVRPVASSGQKSFFIVNCRNSSFFYYQNGEVAALYGHEPVVQKLPLPPEGFEISHVDVAIHLVKKTGIPNVSGKPVTKLEAAHS
ncbi:Fur family transcriptional regulator, iron response regulator [Bartonella apis]|uniref:Fur family transcriptional regulator n=1 Tax=Bartonella apis TaxID=1686310 RepID=UPI0009598979|nr:transcriptional repressor [Bartonella apis]OLY46453.1 Fur family transcriptional regulator, iron response regulator [Bartonella apis]